MALPTNNSRPAIPYAPAQILPNYNRYEALGRFPPTALQLDADLNALMDFINTLSQAINETIAAGLPGAANPLNANALVTTDGAGNISWTLVNAANLDVNAVQTQHIQNGAITSPKIQPQAIGTNQLAVEAVLTENIGVGAVRGNNIAPNTIPLSKLSVPSSPCVIAGTTTTRSWYQLTFPDWGIISKAPGLGGPLMYTLDQVWANTANTFSASKLTDSSTTRAKLTEDVKRALVPTGCIMPYAASAAPAGWTLCDGRSVLRTSYPTLFEVIGITYGSVNENEFNLPDLRGRAIFGYVRDSAGGRITQATADRVALGGQGGEETHMLTVNEMPSHNHNFTAITSRSTISGQGVDRENPAAPSVSTTSNTGGGQAHNNMPPFILLNWIIKT